MPDNRSAIKTHGVPFVGASIPAVITLTDAASISMDASQGNRFRVTLGGNRTLANPTNPKDGQVITVEVNQDSVGSRTLSLDTAFAYGTDILQLNLSTLPNATDYVVLTYHGLKSKWHVTGTAHGY